MTRTVLVTGAASGIGLAQVQAFLQEGYEVYGLDKDPAPFEVEKFHFLQWNLTDDLGPVFDWCPKTDVLCNTAGVLDAYKPLLEQSDVEMETIFDVNFFSMVRLTRHYLGCMLEQKAGVIINMCSVASFLAGGGGAAYTASKHAVAGLTKELALDYGSDNIQVFGLAPGAVKTAMTAGDFQPGGLADWVAEETPIKRWLLPEEVARVTMFLASGQAGAMQGEIVKIDGGWSIK